MTVDVDVVTLVALTPERAAEAAGLSLRQVAYWTRTGLVEATVERSLTLGRPIRLYGYVDLMSLLVAAELKQSRGVSLQHIRKIVAYLRGEGFRRPLTELRYATAGGQVYVQHPDGMWEAGFRPGQVVIHHVISLEPLRARIQSVSQRDARTVGRVERRRGALGGKELVAGTRVPVDTVRRYLEQGFPTERVLRAFPVLEAADVDAVRATLTAAS